jgi:hypothetical protein
MPRPNTGKMVSERKKLMPELKVKIVVYPQDGCSTG